MVRDLLRDVLNGRGNPTRPFSNRLEPIITTTGGVQLRLRVRVTKGDNGEAMVKLKRVYDPVSRADGTRFLVERLWPRGLSKERLHLTAWLKDVGPSTELRQWFNHDPLKWSQFRTRYFRELDSQPESWQPILAAARRGMVTLVYSSHDEEHNNAVALTEYLQAKRRRPSSRRRSATANPSRADR